MQTHNGIVSSDGTWRAVERVGGAQDLATDLARITALPDHGADGARGQVGDQSLEEGLLGQVRVVLLQVLLAGSHHLDGDELVAAVLEAGEDGADQAALDTIGLDGDEAERALSAGVRDGMGV